MRIITGKFKGRKLVFPKAKDVRPAMDKVRESIFNILGEVVLDAQVLDLFAGSGSMGFEALSRGARHATFVENHKSALDSIRKNASNLKLVDNFTIIPQGVNEALSFIKKSGPTFNLIFVDPPYDKGYIRKTLSHIIEFDILRAFGWIVLEHSKDEKPEEAGEYRIVKERRFGQTLLTFLFRRA